MIVPVEGSNIRWRRYGERGVVIDLPSLDAIHQLHRAVLAADVVEESVPGAETLYLRARTPLTPDGALDLVRKITSLDTSRSLVSHVTTHEVGVVYDGPDLEDVASLTGLSAEEVVRRHSGGDYIVAFVGFSRGFAYLAGLDPLLIVPRLSTPRTSVAAGSVAMGAGFTGIYPATTPGGWRLIGYTNITCFDEYADPPSRFAPGDRVRFLPVRNRTALIVPGSDASPAMQPSRTPSNTVDTHRTKGSDTENVAGSNISCDITVLTSGPFTTVQDRGRIGLAHHGVARSGAFDAGARALANRLVGNDDSSAVFEVLLGPFEVLAARELVVAVTGARTSVSVDENAHAQDVAFVVPVGAKLRIGRSERGMRTIVAVRGGIETERVLHSRSWDSLGKIGQPPLRDGDRLHVGTEAIGDAWFESVPSRLDDDEPFVPLLLGPHDDWFSDAGRRTLLSARWTLHAASDRTGLRFEGPVIDRREGELTSTAMVPGAIQVPASGQPIVLGPDGGVTGGYPVIGVVTHTGLDMLAQLRPGSTCRFSIS